MAAMKRLFIHTMGCQMNEHDSERLAELFGAAGYVLADGPADADVILVNSCTVREKAEHKAWSALGRYAALNGRNGKRVLIAAGCVAEQCGSGLFGRLPGVHLVAGPDHYARLPEAVEDLLRTGVRTASTGFDGPEVATFLRPSPEPQRPPSVHLTIMKGCDERCTFCIVPQVRGPARFRPADEIVEDARRLVERGAREIQLLGQTVNAYVHGGVEFAALLARLDRVAGLERIRYTSPHPRYMTDDLIRAHAELPSLCEHVHLPLQAGSDRTLRRMGRRHTRAEALDRIGRLKQARPGLEVSTDLIVGFPGETREEYEETLSLMTEARFRGTFSFAYSPREGTPASRLEDDVPAEEKAERLYRLHEVQEGIEAPRRLALVGSLVQVLVEGPAQRGQGQVTGRTRMNDIVNLPRPPADSGAIAGRLVHVRIAEAKLHSLLGAWLADKEVPPC